ncbi:MAG: lipoate--protein ligase family protein [Synechococcales cyanobacterium T60_A2020_003]|nr:lipoate--protein ligase family protein [Synechococcales cyanobacterium T60_A2020_003]
MAIDTWLLDQHRHGQHPPTLRFYTWNPAAISLGYHQRQYPEHWHNLQWQGQTLDRVRRPSGGRAVLHQGDLTYAVIGSGFEGSRMQAYQRICEFLIAGWRSLGVTLTYGQAGRGYIHNPNCFGTATVADLVLPDGTKLIGSAQLRRGNAILQHGSIRLATDLDLYRAVFPDEPEAAYRMPTLPDPLGSLSFDQTVAVVISALKQAFCDCMQVDLVEQPWTDTEGRSLNFSLQKR